MTQTFYQFIRITPKNLEVGISNICVILMAIHLKTLTGHLRLRLRLREGGSEKAIHIMYLYMFVFYFVLIGHEYLIKVSVALYYPLSLSLHIQVGMQVVFSNATESTL